MFPFQANQPFCDKICMSAERARPRCPAHAQLRNQIMTSKKNDKTCARADRSRRVRTDSQPVPFARKIIKSFFRILIMCKKYLKHASIDMLIHKKN